MSIDRLDRRGRLKRPKDAVEIQAWNLKSSQKACVFG